jgi:hypothetical protein
MPVVFGIQQCLHRRVILGQDILNHLFLLIKIVDYVCFTVY